MGKAADEDARLAKVPDYVKLTKQLEAARAALSSGETTAKLADLNNQVKAAKVVADDKDQIVRFTKSELTERWYDYNHAIQTNGDSRPIKEDIDRLNQRLVGEQAVSDDAKAKEDALKGQIEALNSKVDTITEAAQEVHQKARRLYRQGRHLHDPGHVQGPGSAALSKDSQDRADRD